MTRKGPTASATIFPVGTEKRGNDGNIWAIVQNKNGVKRWQKTSSKVFSKVSKVKYTKRKRKTRKRKRKIIDLNKKKSSDELLPKITNYRGLWKPQPKPLRQMKRAELIKNLQEFRDAWERTTTRNADLGDSRLQAESTENLRELLKWHYSDDAKQLAGEWLRK
tara:strand:- start:145 stop:636 length:492 start_codon:yes stop_codon:yes gene_type:complete